MSDVECGLGFADYFVVFEVGFEFFHQISRNTVLTLQIRNLLQPLSTRIRRFGEFLSLGSQVAL